MTEELIDALEALADMWGQYCPPPYTHMFMSAGEGAEHVLLQYDLLYLKGPKKGEIKWHRFDEMRKTYG